MAIEVRMPRLTSSMVEATITEWLAREGDPITEGGPLLTVESDKAITEVSSPASGTLLKIIHTAGKIVEAEQVVAYIGVPGEKTLGLEPSGVESKTVSRVGAGLRGPKPQRVLASPAAKRLAAERGIDLAKVTGSGAEGLIFESDVVAYADARESQRPPSSSPYGQATEIPLTGNQQAMSRRMLTSRQEVVQGTTFTQVDMTAALEHGKRVGAGVTAMVGMATIRALARHTLINSCLTATGLRIHDYVNLGVAVATERGLIVPVIHNAEKLELGALAEAIARVAESARVRPLTPRELSDATITVTNAGALGALMFVPVLSYPQSAILGVGEVVEAPVVRDGEVKVRWVTRLALSYNHRVIDGAVAVPFLKKVRALLEDPGQL